MRLLYAAVSSGWWASTPIALRPLGLVGSSGDGGCRGLVGRYAAASAWAIPAGHSRGGIGCTRGIESSSGVVLN